MVRIATRSPNMSLMKTMLLGLLALTLGSTAGELEKAKAYFSKQDQTLNQVYANLKKSLAPHLFSQVQQDQRDWIRYRDGISDFQTRGKAREDSIEWYESAAGLTESRVNWLKGWAVIDQREGMVGKWSDSRGGWLEIVKKDGEFWFSLNVVRGPTYHLGQIGGKFRVNGNTGWFELESEFGDAPTWLTFVGIGDGTGRMRIIGENTQPHHGARAYFDGDYLWLGPLTAEEQREVVEGRR